MTKQQEFIYAIWDEYGRKHPVCHAAKVSRVGAKMVSFNAEGSARVAFGFGSRQYIERVSFAPEEAWRKYKDAKYAEAERHKAQHDMALARATEAAFVLRELPKEPTR